MMDVFSSVTLHVIYYFCIVSVSMQRVTVSHVNMSITRVYLLYMDMNRLEEPSLLDIINS